jgi:hypothetical protein
MRPFLTYCFCCVLLTGGASAYQGMGAITGEQQGDQFGSAIATVDFNADGVSDLVVGAPASDVAGTSSGQVAIHFGGEDNLVADMILKGTAGSFFGQSIAPAGDFNHDGYEDLLIGAPFYDLPDTNAGAVGLYYGGPAADTLVDHIFTGIAGGDFYGTAVASAGDFNADGYDDIVIGAYKADWGAFEDAGKAYIYYGGPSPDFVADLILTGVADGERFGHALVSADFNGDDVSDIAAGAYSYDGSHINQGRVYVFYGGNDPDSLYDLSVVGANAGYRLGWSLAAGMVNDDSESDLIVGIDGYPIDTANAGQVRVYFGGPGFDNVPDFSWDMARDETDRVGRAVASGADWDSDGDDEILVGMPGNDDAGSDAGGVVLINGGASPAYDGQVLGLNASEELGEAVALWSGFGTESTIVMALGASGYDSFRGRVAFYGPSGPGCCQLRGDINANGSGPDVSDLVYLVTYMFSGGPPPPCMEHADVNGNGSGPDVSDLVYLVTYMFSGGPPPAPC